MHRALTLLVLSTLTATAQTSYDPSKLPKGRDYFVVV